MGVWIATRTKELIDRSIAYDGGNMYRANLGRVLPHITDAYRADEDGYRTHLGASVIGGDCERALFYGWRWAHKRPPRGRKGEPQEVATSRMVRLWNRGHLEEGRFVAMLLASGMQVYQQDENGKQFRMMDFGGHYSGSGDGFVMGCPDLPLGVPALLECKTHGDKSFAGLLDVGVRLAKPQHYVQMQQYMGKFGCLYALYMAVNKNDDELYCEIVPYDAQTDAEFLARARRLVFTNEIPPRIRGASPGYFVCKHLCDHTDVCFKTVPPDRNCRTCAHAFAMPDGTWQCAKYTYTLSKEEQLRGCLDYTLMEALR